MTTPKNRFSLQLLAVFLFVALFSPITGFSQTADEEKLSKVEGRVDGLDDRLLTLEGTVSGMAKLKITGYVQPQWVWQGTDSLVNPQLTRSYFQVRRGRVKFTYKSGDIGAVVYPDITEQGVIIKEVYSFWDFAHMDGMTMLQLSLGAMNRPFGYEIALSSSAREVVERSVAENRLFNGERDLGVQLAYTPSFGSLKPVLELGLFNGSDNFGAGPINDINNSSANTDINSGNLFFFGAGQIQGATGGVVAKGADSAYIAGKVIPQLGATAAFTTANAWKQNQKEFMGHLRLPFLLSDEFSFDIGGSWSIGGITPPSNIAATYTTGGVLKLDGTAGGPSGTFNPKTGWEPSGLFLSNRTIFGADAQIYLSVLPIGGTIIKAEMYTGTVPFYGSAALVSSADATSLNGGTAAPVLVKKSVMGYYVMLVQNITDWLQLAARIENYDPNTNVTGADFAANNGVGPTINGTPYLKAASNFGGDLALNTITVGLNFFAQGNLRFMFDYDHQKQEEYQFNAGTPTAPVITTKGSPNLDKFTARMQVKF